MKKVWITKSLLQGVVERQVEDIQGDWCKAVQLPTEDRWQRCFYGKGKVWHRTRKCAVARMEHMRQAKIASLKKQIAKLEAMTIE